VREHRGRKTPTGGSEKPDAAKSVAPQAPLRTTIFSFENSLQIYFLILFRIATVATVQQQLST